RLASVVSKAKLARWAASSRSRATMTRPAAITAPSGLNAERPLAMTSALTNSFTASAPRKRAGATVDFPAPFGPARTTPLGRGSRTSHERRMAERVGFEPTCRLPDKTLSRRPRYDHFGTSPYVIFSRGTYNYI